MNVQKIAAFSDGELGGNPAGVHIAQSLPAENEMQRIAASVGFSETAFASPVDDGWRVRYFSPETEVPFCGHATIALGAALTKLHGPSVFPLILNQTNITVEGFQEKNSLFAALQSPSTFSRTIEEDMLGAVLETFGYQRSDLLPDIPPAFAHAGANHLVITLKSREALKSMAYELNAGRTLMNSADVVTIAFTYPETERLFHTRNPFASGGVYEDPATGAATAAFAGYLRDLGLAQSGDLDFVQGEDMGCRSVLRAQLSDVKGESIRVSGQARFM